MMIIFAFLLLCVYSCSSKECPKKSFDNVYVQVVEPANLENVQIVSECISNRTVIFHNLKSLKIRSQDVRVLKTGAVSDISDHFSLWFNNNNITTIDHEAFLNLPGLVSLDLDHNQIEWIEQDAFRNLPSLESINLESNHLEILPAKIFVDLPNLTVISLNANKLHAFQQDWFYDTPKLIHLFLNDNAIRSLPKAAFAGLPSLKRISLTNNKISYVHKKAFFGLKQLLEMDLSQNLMSSLDFNFKTMPNLSFLGVNQNHLNFVSDYSLKSMQSSLSSIAAHLNPWQCLCLDKLLEWALKRTINVQWKCKNVQVICVLPKDGSVCTEPMTNEYLLEKLPHFTGSQCVKKLP